MKSVRTMTMLGACAALLLGAAAASQAQEPRGQEHFRAGARPAPVRRAPARAEPHAWRAPGWAGRDHDMRFDSRYNHGYYYPRFGASIGVLPGGYRRYYWHGAPYYFAGGIWYAAGPGGAFIVSRPPIGLFVPILPPFYTTVWFGGVPYYYSDDTYYLWQPNLSGYVVAQPPGPDSAAVTTPPPGAEEPAAPGPTEDFYIYPKNGQSEQQQQTDRYQCYSWAKDQTGFDPTQAGGGVPPDQATAKRADYRRAMGACLDARGYSIK